MAPPFPKVEKIEIKIFCSYFVITFLNSGKSGKMETRFIELCIEGDLIGLQQLLQLHPDINISTKNEYAFRYACKRGHLHVCKWLLQVKPNINISAKNEEAFRVVCYMGHLDICQWLIQVKPSINISAENEYAFRYACFNGRLDVCQWLLQVSKERGQDINISFDNEEAFRYACLIGYLHVAKWLQSLKPYLYVIEYDETGKIKGYKVRSKEDANWEKRKYLVWLASNHCPEQNKVNLLYKLPSDVSRMVIGFV